MDDRVFADREIAVMAVLGAVFWLAFALLVRVMEPVGLLQGAARAVVFALAVPGTLGLIWGIGRVMRYPAARMVEAVGIITGVAIILDGLAFGFFPGLYGQAASHQVAGAGLILWGGGWGMVAALWLQRRAGG